MALTGDGREEAGRGVRRGETEEEEEVEETDRRRIVKLQKLALRHRLERYWWASHLTTGLQNSVTYMARLGSGVLLSHSSCLSSAPPLAPFDS